MNVGFDHQENQDFVQVQTLDGSQAWASGGLSDEARAFGIALLQGTHEPAVSAQLDSSAESASRAEPSVS